MKKLSGSEMGKIAVIVIAIVGGLWMIVADSNSGEVQNSSIESSKKGAISTQVANQSTTISPAVCEGLPIEMRSAPSADVLVLAARLIQESADPAFAAATIQLQNGRDLAQTEAEMWEYKASVASNKKKVAEATDVMTRIQNGTFTPVNDEGDELAMQTRARNTVLGIDKKQAASGNREGPLVRLGSISEQGDMMVLIDDRWFRGVRVGQIINGYLVESFDEHIKCVHLKNTQNDNQTMKTACLN